MALVAIAIADAALEVALGDALLATSPGVALVDAGGIVTGAAAAAAARLKPLSVNDRYWTEFSDQPLARPAPGARTHADLAWRQLAELRALAGGEVEGALFAVPSHWREPELGLLAGVSAAAGLPVAGIVDAAVAACAGLDAGFRVLHLDVHLHQAVLARLEGERTLVRRDASVAPRAGLRALHGAWAQLVAGTMVRRTRFDPLHQAASEQALHDRLPEWLAAVARAGRAEIALEFGGRSFAVELPAEECALAAEAWYTQLEELVAAAAGDEPVTLALSARAAALPGLATRLARVLDAPPLELPPAAAAFAALAHRGAVRSEGELELVTGLERRHAAARPAPRAARGAPATHLVHAGVAHRLDTPLVIGTEPAAPRALQLPAPLPGVSRRHCTIEPGAAGPVLRDHSRHGSFLNGERVAGAVALAAGDRLRLGTPGVVLELVAVA